METEPIANENLSDEIKHLCLAGGSMKGIAYIGVYKALKELNLLSSPLESIVGCSIGSFSGLLILLGYTSEELYSFVTSFKYDDVKDWNFINFFNTWGIESGERINRFFQAFMKNKTDCHDLTFQELYSKYPTKFTVVYTNLRTHQPIYCNHQNTPDHSVITAIRRSINLPFMMTRQLDSETHDCYVDGAITDNFPIQECPDDSSTLGICFTGQEEHNHQIDNLEDYAYNMFCCMFSQTTKYKLTQVKEAHIINLDPQDYQGHNLNVSVEQRKKLHDDSYQTTLDYFAQNKSSSKL